MSRNDGDEQVFGFDVLSVRDEEFGDFPGNCRVDIGLHLHGFEREEFCAAFDGLIGLHGDAGDDAGGGRADLAGIGGVGLGMGALDAWRARSRTLTSRGWPLSSKNNVRVPSGCGSLAVRNLMMSVLPASMSTVISSPDLQAVEKWRRWEGR